ncbi:Ribosome-binding ATPase YchF [archaeon HR01]|nr:Ribosome-binding ATPase YchF [archaeon HR01]
MELAGIVGKPNVGKSTLFSALTLVNVEIASYPFTTRKPNVGVTYLRVDCVCRELGLRDNPRNSLCVDGVRLVPIQVIDCPGIVPGAHMGRGLGLQFLDDIRQASCLIVVVDASGSTADDGTLSEPGSHDPRRDVELVENEVTMWMAGLLWSEWPRISRAAEARQASLRSEIARKLSGLGVGLEDVDEALNRVRLDERRPTSWRREDVEGLAGELRRLNKPMIVAANKIDIEGSDRYVRSLRDAGYDVIPCSAEAERVLRLAAEKGLIRYVPGDPDFTAYEEKLSQAQKNALEKIRERVLRPWKGTGVQQIIDKAYMEKLGYVPVFPVEDPHRYSDRSGNILPDVYLVKKGSTPRQLAEKIHTELAEGYLYAVDARTGMRLGEDYRLKSHDIISIVSAKRRA